MEHYFPADAPWEDLGEGLSRQIMGYDKKIMMVKVKFEKGAIGQPHWHPHSQTTYIISGEFEFTVGGKVQVMKPGDGLYVPPDVEHGAVCLKAGELIDVFSPMREDFVG